MRVNCDRSLAKAPRSWWSENLMGIGFPSPVMTFRNDGVTYAERVFVAPTDAPGADPARLNCRSVCVTEFLLTNEEAKDSPVRLALNFLVNSREKTPANIAKCPQGWLVTGKQGPLALITITTAADSDLTASAEGGQFLLTGTLPTQGTARCLVFLRARDEDLTNLPSFAKLHAAFESHWNAALGASHANRNAGSVAQ